MNKKIVILEHNNGRLANQLWPYISAYAYCLERGYKLENWSFFQYAHFFTMPRPWIFTIKRFYHWYVLLIKKLFPKSIDEAPDADRPITHYLPPTPSNDPIIDAFEKNSSPVLYLCGPAFRNPLGLEKYREQIRLYFQPREDLKKSVSNFVDGLRTRYENVVGVHIRQTDYKKFKGGKYFFEQAEVRKILEEYLVAKQISKEKTIFILCSDAPVDLEIFAGLQVVSGLGGMIEDLFTLAATDTIIGSDSTFGAFAAYYGNIPMIVFEHTLDWNFYKDRTTYWENPKCTFVFY